MFKVGDKVKVTVVSMNRDMVYRVLEVHDDEWMGKPIKSYTITNGVVTATLTEDVLYEA